LKNILKISINNKLKFKYSKRNRHLNIQTRKNCLSKEEEFQVNKNDEMMMLKGQFYL